MLQSHDLDCNVAQYLSDATGYSPHLVSILSDLSSRRLHKGYVRLSLSSKSLYIYIVEKSWIISLCNVLLLWISGHFTGRMTKSVVSCHLIDAENPSDWLITAIRCYCGMDGLSFDFSRSKPSRFWCTIKSASSWVYSLVYFSWDWT